MKIGIISDTHGNHELLNSVSLFLEKELKIEALIHLGDNYCDCDKIKSENIKLYRIPGFCCLEFTLPQVKNIQEFTLCQNKIVIAHYLKDIPAKQKQNASIVMGGHTHNWSIEQSEKTLIINPGHLKYHLHRKRVATFVFFELAVQEAMVTVYDYDFKIKFRYTYQLHNPQSATTS